jgi:hypothetical protein
MCTLLQYVFMCILMQYFFLTDLDIYGEPSAHSIIRKLRLQKNWQQDEERIALQNKVMITKHHFRAMCATGEVTDQNAEVTVF